MIWGLGSNNNNNSSSSGSGNNDGGKGLGSTISSSRGKKFGRRRRQRSKGDSEVASGVTATTAREPSPALTARALGGLSLSDESMSVSETGNGIEISLDWDVAQQSRQSLLAPVVSYHRFLQNRQKVKRCQLCVNNYPALPKSFQLNNDKDGNKNGGITNGKNQHGSGSRMNLTGTNRRTPVRPLSVRHRIHYTNQGGGRHPHNAAGEAGEESVSLDEMIFLLQSHTVRDEVTSVRAEAQKISAEIESLESDLIELEQDFLCIPKHHNDNDDWDVEWILKHNDCSPKARQELQRLRGRCLTLQLHNSATRDMLVKALGLQSLPRRNKYRLQPNRTTLTPTDCKAGGAGETLRHLCLLPATSNSSHHPTFFLSQTTGGVSGEVPPPLWQRMRRQNLQLDSILYLAVGPNDTYYCTLTSGHIWWGCADADFGKLVQDWDVHRVAFGSTSVYQHSSSKTTVYSWIVVGRDGRVAFKNLPTRLQHKLESRLASWAAPAEVSLGSDESYFVRFLDGTIDYCLPVGASSVCEYVVQKGAKVTNVVLHPELPQDFVVRHTEMKI